MKVRIKRTQQQENCSICAMNIEINIEKSVKSQSG